MVWKGLYSWKRKDGMKINEDFLYIIVNCISRDTIGGSNSANTSRTLTTPRNSAKPTTPRPGGTTTHTPLHTEKAQTKPTTPEAALPPPPTNPFDFIYSEKGFSNLKKWFSQNASSNKNLFNENQFITFLRELTDFGDHQILEVFDTFDHNDQGAISFNEFFLIISLLVARETGQTTRFLYLHGREIFDLMADRNSKSLTFEQFSRLGFIIGMSEDQIFANLKDFNLDLFNLISYEDFLLYYFAIFDDWDKGRKAQENLHSSQGAYVGDNSKKACIIS